MRGRETLYLVILKIPAESGVVSAAATAARKRGSRIVEYAHVCVCERPCVLTLIKRATLYLEISFLLLIRGALIIG